MLFLTDGFDSGSTHSWHQAVDAANSADAVVYAIQYRSGFGGVSRPTFTGSLQRWEAPGSVRPMANTGRLFPASKPICVIVMSSDFDRSA
jgi:hypothetical protein